MNRLKIFAENIIVHEAVHFLSGIVMFFLILKKFGRLEFALIAFFVSLLIDIDHYLEGLLVNKLRLEWIFTTAPHVFWKRTNRMTILFHSWELLPVVLFLGKIFDQWPLAVAIVLPSAIHCLADTLIYGIFCRTPVYQYFLIYRACRHFVPKGV